MVVIVTCNGSVGTATNMLIATYRGWGAVRIE